MEAGLPKSGKPNDTLIIVDDFLTINPFSRSGKPLDRVMALVMHNVGVGGQSARIVRNYWEGLKSQDAMDANPDVSASAHFVVDLDGTIIRTVPENERAYHCGAANYSPEAKAFFGNYCTDRNSSSNRVTLGIELTHPDSSGKPTAETYESAQSLVRFLCGKYDLDPLVSVWRHWDVSRKICPRWFIANYPEWRAFLESI